MSDKLFALRRIRLNRISLDHQDKCCEKLSCVRMKPFRIIDPTCPLPNAQGRCALAVMTKAPQAGQVKTRLVPPLTPDEAAEVNKSFLRDTTSTISSAAKTNSA